MSWKNIPEKEMKALIANSGGVCAFPGCDKRFVEPGNDLDAAAFLGEMAHIDGDSRQGPRRDFPLPDEDRDKHTNLLLLFGRGNRSQTVLRSRPTSARRHGQQNRQGTLLPRARVSGPDFVFGDRNEPRSVSGEARLGRVGKVDLQLSPPEMLLDQTHRHWGRRVPLPVLFGG